MNLTDISHELGKAQVEYEGKAQELNDAQEKKRDAEIELIRADSTWKRLRLETTVYRSKVQVLLDQSYNLRAEAKIR